MDKKRMIGFGMIAAGMLAMIFCMVAVATSGGFVIKPSTKKTASTQSSENEPLEFEDEQTKKTTTTTSTSSTSDSISIPGIKKWTVPAGQTTVDTDFYNPEKNDCYFVLTITLSSTNEQIYQSKYLKPGQHLYEIELTKGLDAGTYDAILRYDTYDMETNSPLNGASVPFTLVAK